MRLNVNIDRKRLGEIGYQNAPIRQILKLKIPQFEQLLLLNFFSNSQDWDVSVRSISRSFGIRKDRDAVRTGLSNLIESNYLIHDENGYTINLDKIKSDSLLSKKPDRYTTTDRNSTTGDKPTTSHDSNTATGVTETLSGDDRNTTSLSDRNTTTNKINIKEKEINDNQEINPVKENLDFDSNSSIDLGFGFDLENIALKQPKEIIGNNYKLVNVNNVSTVVSKDYYDRISTNQDDTIISNVSSKPTDHYKYLKFDDSQKSKLDLKFREVRAYNCQYQFNFEHFEGLLIKLSCSNLGISESAVNINQVNTFLVDSINNNTKFFQDFVGTCNHTINKLMDE